MTTGPQLPFSDELHSTKYRQQGESHREAMGRNASAMCDGEDHYKAFRELTMDMRFMAAGRVQAGMGSTKNVTSHNCFVSGTIEDSFIEGHGSIMGRATEAAATMRMGGGIGYDFSTLRPRGALIKKLQSRSSGPVSFMGIFDAICRCVASSGHRRGAQMAVLRVDHPDIEEFVHAKQNKTELTGFNISVAITDDFMECLATGRPFKLKWNGEVYREVDARDLWEQIMRSTWDWAEPGVLFIDTINRMNNLHYCEDITATNPCGEQPLPPYGACLLGSFNAVRYLRRTGIMSFEFNYNQLAQDIPHVVRAMDNVIDRAHYPLYEQEKEARSKRRIGLGITGLANALEAMGHPYGSEGFLEIEEEILELIAAESYRASALLAKEKGHFPLFDRSQYLQGEFIRKLPGSVQKLIYDHGIRNSHLTSIAPTGTISLCADNVSSGIEPVFAYSFDRTVIEFEAPRVETVEDYGVRVLGVKGKVSADVTVKEHLAVLEVAQRNVDSAVSKTCNVPSDTTWEEFKQIYVDAWEAGCKGCTTFRMNGKRDALLTVKEDDTPVDVIGKATGTDDGAACYIDPTTGRHECE
jgi:ribonucleoside-diphosphate reductase alpha chain